MDAVSRAGIDNHRHFDAASNTRLAECTGMIEIIDVLAAALICCCSCVTHRSEIIRPGQTAQDGK